MSRTVPESSLESPFKNQYHDGEYHSSLRRTIILTAVKTRRPHIKEQSTKIVEL